MRVSCVAELIPRTDKNHEFELLFSLALHPFIIADDVVQSLKILTNPPDFIFSITGQSLIHLSISPFRANQLITELPKDPPRLRAIVGQFRLSVGPALAHQERDDNMQMPEWYWWSRNHQKETQDFGLEYLHCQFSLHRFLLLRQALTAASLSSVSKILYLD